MKKFILILWGIFIGAWLLFFGVFFLIWNGVIGYMPPIEQLQNPIDKYASQLIASDGVSLGVYARTGENRIYTSYKDISPELIKALVATEDRRFASHSGIDARGLFRAVIKRGILFQKAGGGGSTITQQLAKLLYSPKAENIVERLLQKPIEWGISLKLEKYYTKEEIVCLYLNQFDFLYNAIGIRSASKVYFSKTPLELNLQEAATLVGMLKNPSYFNPILHKNKERVLGRRNVVLQQMYKAGYITHATLDSVSQEPLETRFSRLGHNEGLAPYFREYIRKMMTAHKPEKKYYPKWGQEQYSIDSLLWEEDPLYGWCAKNKKADGSSYNLYEDGLKIYASIDTSIQRYAEESVKEHLGETLQALFDKEKKGSKIAPYSNKISAKTRERLIMRAMKQSDRWYQMQKSGASQEEILRSFNTKRKMQVWSWKGYKEVEMTPRDSILYYKKFLRSSFMAMNPYDGKVLAYVGGIDFRTFKYDMVTQGKRQVGSTIKPFLYSLLMTEGLTPCDEMRHEQVTLYDANGRPWSPRSGGAKREGEMVSLKWGLQHSSNWVTAYLMGKTSPITFVRLLRSYGITGHIDPVISLAAGTPSISLAEMVSAYTSFVAKGIRVNPVFVTRIEDQSGNVIATFSPKMTEVLSEDASYKMLDMLQAVVDGGTGSRLRRIYKLTMPIGGKTGTTQHNSDAWFMGVTPQIVAGCWVGGEERSIHFNSTANGQGAAAALPVLGKFLQKLYGDKDLPYDESYKFDFPLMYSPCHTETIAKEEQYVNPEGDLDVIDDSDEEEEEINPMESYW